MRGLSKTHELDKTSIFLEVLLETSCFTEGVAIFAKVVEVANFDDF